LRPADKRSLAVFGFGYLAEEHVDANVWRSEFLGPGDQFCSALGNFDLAAGLDVYLAINYYRFSDNLGGGADLYSVDDHGAYQGAFLSKLGFPIIVLLLNC